MPLPTVKADECRENRKEMYEQIHEDRKDLSEIKGGINFAKWFIPLVIVLIGSLVVFIYKTDMMSIHRRLDAIVSHLNIHNSTATIAEPEVNTP